MPLSNMCKLRISILAIKLANLCKGCHLRSLQPSALEKLIILKMKTEKHPVAMKICITQDFSVFFIII